MNLLHNLVCVYSADLLRSVPIPESFGDITRLSFKEWIGLVLFGAATTGVGYCIYETVMSKAGYRQHPINLDIQKHLDKCVDVVDVESIVDKKCYCRCWRSAKFPFCDGSHKKFNEENGDNIGPLVLKPKSG
ncbi:unnamed protein product [Calicophoron daubneyi]|uniref:CDGSH iron-sulfur domain-containing protein 2 homologue n=1 Tax=Calicophoron daubneyi TaxID=300641 RepID=A0AAV2TL57_CALDB